MAQIREHVSQHDAIADLPLVTESARVVEVADMDRDRRPEITDAIAALLDDRGLTDEYGPIEGPEDWDGLHAQLVDDGHADVARRITTLVERYDRPNPMLTRVRIRPDEEVDFLSGQYVGLRYDGTSRAYSLASSPTREDLELCVRRVPGGRLSPHICDDLATGDELTVRGPYGDLVLQDDSPRDVVFLATGTGVAPFRSMILSLFAAGEDVVDDVTRDVWLFLGARWADDLPYHAAFADLAEDRENFHYVPTLSRESLLTDWGGETAYVQYVLANHVDPTSIKGSLPEAFADALESDPVASVDERLDPEEMDVYACGVTAMVTSLVDAVEALGVPEERTEFEAFG